MVDGIVANDYGIAEESDFAIDFAAFTDAICGKDVPWDAYGKPGNVIYTERECHVQFQRTISLSNDLVGCISRSAVHKQTPYVDSVQKAGEKLDAFLENLPRHEHDAFCQKMEARMVSLKGARSTLSIMTSRVDAHVRERVKADRHYLAECGDDALDHIVRYIDPSTASRLLRTAKAFRDRDALKKRIPHLRIRPVVGVFPHHRAMSRDRVDLLRGSARAVTRDFVLNRQAVRCYVDFVLPTLRTTPLKKKPRKDGLDNNDHDFSDDEFEDAPESQAKRGPGFTTSDTSVSGIQKAQRRQKEWTDADGPAEKVDRYMYNQVIPYSRYFEAPLNLTTKLVYADTHELVACSRFKGAIEPSNQLARHDGIFFASRKWAPVIVPAMAKFHIPHLSTDHGGRLFKLCITGAGRFVEPPLMGGKDFETVIFSAPFEVVSKMPVVANASKRKTREQLREQKRAKPGPGSVA